MSSSDVTLTTHPKGLGRCVERSSNLGGDGQFLLIDIRNVREL